MSVIPIIRVPNVWRLCGIPHNRHTSAALSLAADASERGLFIVMKRLGHKDIRTTINICGHLAPDVDVAHADDLDAAWLAPDPVSNVVPLHKEA
jgi:integrase